MKRCYTVNLRITKGLQRGAVDLVSVAVGLLILSIVVAGTSAAMIYGRETLIREEHYKAAAYILRGKMEEQMAAMQLIEEARDYRKNASCLAAINPLESAPLDLYSDNNGKTRIIYVVISRDEIQPIDIPETSLVPDYFQLTMRAKWRERDLAENSASSGTQSREIVLTTAVIIRGTL